MSPAENAAKPCLVPTFSFPSEYQYQARFYDSMLTPIQQAVWIGAEVDGEGLMTACVYFPMLLGKMRFWR